MKALISLDVNEILSTLHNGLSRSDEREFCDEVFSWLEDRGDQIKDLREELSEATKRADAADSLVIDRDDEIESLKKERDDLQKQLESAAG